MISKKILIVSRSFYPETSPRSLRTTELALELARQGHDVTVLTINPQFDYGDYEEKYGIRILNILTPKFLKHNLFSTKRSFIVRVKDRLLYQAFLFPDIELAFLIKKELLKQKEHYDLLISIAVPYSVHIGCAAALKSNKKKITKCWVADCGDPFTGLKTVRYYFPFYFKWLEKWMFSIADFISVPIEEAKPAYPEVAQRKIVIIPQGVNFNRGTLFSGEIKNPIPTFAYAGTFYQSIRNPEKFLNLLANLEQDFKFIVYTSTRNLIEPYVPLLKGKLIINEPISRDRLLYELSKMDFLVNIENANTIMAPSKTIDYAVTQRPILSIHPEDFAPGVVMEFLAGNYQGQLKIKDVDKYFIENVANQFVSLSEKVSC